MINRICTIKGVMFIIVSCCFCLSQIEAQTNEKPSIIGKYQSSLDKLRTIKEFKEFKEDGTYESYKINNEEETLIYSGKYIVVNDSIYLECVEYDLNKEFEGAILPFKYKVKDDSLKQTGIIHVEAKVPSKIKLYYKYKVDGYWFKIQ